MSRRTSSLFVVGVLAVGFAGGVLSNVLMGGNTALAQERAARTLRVQTLVMVDAEGREIGELGVREGGWGLMFRDVEGRERITLGYGTASDYYALRFVDAKGQGRFGCGARGDGKGCGMAMKDPEGKERVSLGVQETGAGLALRNAEGTEIVGIGVGPGGGGDMALKHPYDGHVVWQASQQEQQDQPEEE